MSKRVLIIGIQGFLGNALKEHIKRAHPRYQLFGLSRRMAGPNARNFSCNLNFTKKLTKLLEEIRPDYIFNLAGGRIKDHKRLLSSNLFATVSLFRAVEQISEYNPKIIIPGTAAEYGLPNERTRKITEHFPADPVSWYGYVKLLQTNVGLLYAQKGLDIVVARMFNISGRGVSPDLAIGRFCREIAAIEHGRKEPDISTRNLSGRRDFLDISDVCAALWRLSKSGKKGEIYNVCSGKSYVIRDLLRELLAYSSVRKIAVREDKSKSSGSCDIIGSNAKLKRTAPWQPSVKMSKSLKESLVYYRKQVS